jgi:hypothetical protein
MHNLNLNLSVKLASQEGGYWEYDLQLQSFLTFKNGKQCNYLIRTIYGTPPRIAIGPSTLCGQRTLVFLVDGKVGLDVKDSNLLRVKIERWLIASPPRVILLPDAGTGDLAGVWLPGPSWPGQGESQLARNGKFFNKQNTFWWTHKYGYQMQRIQKVQGFSRLSLVLCTFPPSLGRQWQDLPGFNPNLSSANGK